MMMMMIIIIIIIYVSVFFLDVCKFIFPLKTVKGY
jgi:hypothetical protein